MDMRGARRKGWRRFLAALGTVIVCSGAASTATNGIRRASGVAPTPPMGWNSWTAFGCHIDENVVREAADAMVSSGMRDAGYKYVIVDDCWEASARDSLGKLTADSMHFPHGMKWLADYVHSKNLKIGIYSSSGTMTCHKRPASIDHETADAATFAEWGIDYLKYDNCNNQMRPAIERYQAMGDALAATGRPIVFSVCEWGENKPWEWGRYVGGELWRTTLDVSDSWRSMISILDRQVGLEKYAGPNAWNDPDVLEAGNGGMTNSEYAAQFSLWALLNAPLIAANDLRSMNDSTRAILTNREVIAVDQDWGGKQGYKLKGDKVTQVWIKPMANGDRAVVLLNRGPATATISATTQEIGLSAGSHAMRDVWAHADRSADGTISAQVPTHSATMLVVRH
jgi:alpha-galactosidase